MAGIVWRGFASPPATSCAVHGKMLRMLVRVAPPRVRRSAVHFSWEQDVPNVRQHRNRWSIHFPGIPLDRAAPALLLEMLLSLQLPVWASLADVVAVELPSPVPRVVARWWLAYHEIDNVTVGPLSGSTSYRPWNEDPATSTHVAVTFGGGKDSTLADEALSESLGRDEVLILHAVHPFSARPGAGRMAMRRSRRLILEPVRTRGARVQLMVTDFMANLAPGKVGRPSVNLYLVAGLPALIHHGARAVTVSRTAGAYWTRRRTDGTPQWGNWRYRPEALAALGHYFQRVLGIAIEPVTTHFPISEYVSFKTLLRGYPAAFKGIVMCMRATSPRTRWCQDCKKCFEYAVFGLSLYHVDPLFDYDAMFGRSRYVEALIAHIKSGIEPNVHGTVPWAPVIGTRTHFAALCHALHLIDPSLVHDRLGASAARNLALLRAAFGQRPFPAVDAILLAAADACGTQPARIVVNAAARFTDVVDDLPGVLLGGNSVASFAPDKPMRPVTVADLLSAANPAGLDESAGDASSAGSPQ